MYDANTAVVALGWQPRVTFEALLRVLEAEEPEEDGAKSSKRQKVTAGDLVLEEVLRGKY